MSIKRIDVEPNTPEWLAMRGDGFACASEAPAVMGVSSYMTRQQLLDKKSFQRGGLVIDSATVSDFQQKLFNKGHATEAAARAILEAELDEDFYQLSYVNDTYNFWSSLDGVTLDGKVIFEHKLWNAALAESVNNGIVPDSHKWQLVHQLITTGADRVIFMTSDGTTDNRAMCEFVLTNDDKSRLIAGWEQFCKDLESHQVATPKEVVKQDIQQLPELNVIVEGIIRESNAEAWVTYALNEIEVINSIVAIDSDTEFDNAKHNAKTLRGFQDTAKKGAQGIIDQIAPLRDTIDTLKGVEESARKGALNLENLVKKENVRTRTDRINSAKVDLQEHVKALRLPPINVKADFEGAIKGKSNLASIENAIATTLANAKIEVKLIADLIESNNAAFDNSYRHLFPDYDQLVCAEQFLTVVENRVLKEQQRKADEEKAQAEREQKIRNEAEREKQAAVDAEKTSLEREQAEKAKDKERVSQKRREAKEALMALSIDEETAKKIILAISQGKIPNIKMEY